METISNNDKVNEILKAHGLDFHIKKVAMFGESKETILNEVFTKRHESKYFGLLNCKTDEIINTVKEGYTVSQNSEIVELVLKGMETFGTKLTVQKAGSLNGGRKVYIQLAIEGESKVGFDTIKRFVTVIDSNDGSTGLSIGIGDLTMSCQNQFFKFYKKGEAKFRHTATISEKMKTIPMLIELALSNSLKQVELYKAFQSTEITKDLANLLVKSLLGYDRVYTSMDIMSKKGTQSINIMDKLYVSIEREIADKGLNLWGLHSGVTRFTTHEIGSPKRDNGKIESSLLGSAYNMNQKSLEFARRESGILELA
jgi:hypothetical protein